MSDELAQENAVLKQHIANLEQGNLAVQEMLAQILFAIGHPVEVTKEQMKDETNKNFQINIDQNDQSFIFSLTELGN